MKQRFLIILLFSLFLAFSPAKADEGYRVSGVVGQENHWIFAIIEDSSGDCRLYSPGDLLAGSRIIEITPQGVLVSENNEVRLLKLEGSSFVAAANTAEGEILSSPPHLVNGTLPPEELKSAIVTLAAEVERNRQKSLQPQFLNAMLNIPAAARITAIEGTSVQTPQDAVRALRNAVELNHPVRISVSGNPETSTLYLMFQSPKDVADEQMQ